MRMFRQIVSAIACFMLAACGAKNIQIDGGSYRVTSVHLVVTDPRHANDSVYIEKLKAQIATQLPRTTYVYAHLPPIELWVTIDSLAHSKADGYTIHSVVRVVDGVSKTPLTQFPCDVTPDFSDSNGGGGFSGGGGGGVAEVVVIIAVAAVLIVADAFTEEPDDAAKAQMLVESYADKLIEQAH